jgi:hypothetical protein
MNVFFVLFGLKFKSELHVHLSQDHRRQTREMMTKVHRFCLNLLALMSWVNHLFLSVNFRFHAATKRKGRKVGLTTTTTTVVVGHAVRINVSSPSHWLYRYFVCNLNIFRTALYRDSLANSIELVVSKFQIGYYFAFAGCIAIQRRSC